jgi:hypothetical protein
MFKQVVRFKNISILPSLWTSDKLLVNWENLCWDSNHFISLPKPGPSVDFRRKASSGGLPRIVFSGRELTCAAPQHTPEKKFGRKQTPDKKVWSGLNPQICFPSHTLASRQVTKPGKRQNTARPKVDHIPPREHPARLPERPNSDQTQG